MAERVLEMTGQDASRVELLYVGTASYDAVEPRVRQTARFGELGCRVTELDVALRAPEAAVVEDALGSADAIVVSGGNTLYAVDRWRQIGLDGLLRSALERGVVVCGGSAGAICWFDGGHSDSMDPTSYREPVSLDDPRAYDWSYIRVDGLGLLPGLLCPHYDVTGRNGVLRAHDFAAMLRRHAGETGLGLDDWAALLVDGDRYEVVPLLGRGGSVRDGSFVEDGSGVPGLWVLEAGDGTTTMRPAPQHGRLADLVRPARAIRPDPLVEIARAENPLPAV